MLQYFLFLFQFIKINVLYINKTSIKTLDNIDINNNNKNFNSLKINRTINSDINNSKKKNSNYMKKNLLIGAIQNFVWEKISLFFKSFKHSGFGNCDLVIFVDNIPQKTIDKIISYGAIVYPVPKELKKKNNKL